MLEVDDWPKDWFCWSSCWFFYSIFPSWVSSQPQYFKPVVWKFVVRIRARTYSAFLKRYHWLEKEFGFIREQNDDFSQKDPAVWPLNLSVMSDSTFRRLITILEMQHSPGFLKFCSSPNFRSWRTKGERNGKLEGYTARHRGFAGLPRCANSRSWQTGQCKVKTIAEPCLNILLDFAWESRWQAARYAFLRVDDWSYSCCSWISSRKGWRMFRQNSFPISPIGWTFIYPIP